MALPFQTVETVNETAQARQRAVVRAPDPPEEWRNRLIWGDKKYVLPSLLAEFAGKVNLIYIDPPFDTGADFSFTASVPYPSGLPATRSHPMGEGRGRARRLGYVHQRAEHHRTQSVRDTWGRETWTPTCNGFTKPLVLLHEMLARKLEAFTCIWIGTSALYAKLIMDEIFGPERFVNEMCGSANRER